jgi:hypothetical protein
MVRAYLRRTPLLAALLAIAPVCALAADGDAPAKKAPAKKAPAKKAPVPWEESAEPPHFVPWLSPNAQLQTWATLWDQDEDPQADPGGYGDPELDPGFSIPRARLGVTGGWRWVDFGVRVGTWTPYDTLSPTAPAIDLIDGWARLTFDTPAGKTRITVGQHSIAFSREQMMSSNDLIFQERSVSTNWLAPQRDVGASASHSWRYLTASVGVYNGNGSRMGNPDPGVMVAARLEGHVGGDTYRTNSKHNAFGLGAGYIYNRTFVTTEHRIGVDLLARIVGLTLQAEGTMNILDPDGDPTILPPDVPERTQRWGGFAQLSYYRELPIGAIEPAVRISYLDDARHLADNGDVALLHGGVTWREPVPFLDIGAGYIHRMELQGRSLDNDSVRVWVGLRYPSRRFAPVDVIEVFRRLGAKPLHNPDLKDAQDDAKK